MPPPRGPVNPRKRNGVKPGFSMLVWQGLSIPPPLLLLCDVLLLCWKFDDGDYCRLLARPCGAEMFLNLGLPEPERDHTLPLELCRKYHVCPAPGCQRESESKKRVGLDLELVRVFACAWRASRVFSNGPHPS